MTKCLKTAEDMEVFKKMPVYDELLAYITTLSDAMAGTKLSEATPAAQSHDLIKAFMAVFASIRQLVLSIPLQDMDQQRFGNKAFRVFHEKLQESCDEILQPVMNVLRSKNSVSESDTEALKPYFLDSFGNGTRIDYGTGHELHFIILTMLSWKLAEPTVSKEHAQQTVSNVIVEYVEVMRHLQSHYRLEPAGRSEERV